MQMLRLLCWREMNSHWHFRSVTYDEKEFAPSHFQSIVDDADDGDSNLHVTPHFFFCIHHNKKNRHSVLWGSDEGSLGQDTSFLVSAKKKKNHSSLHCYQRTKKSLYLSEVKLISSMESILGWEKSQLWTYFLIYWTMVFSENRIFQILGSNDKGLNDTHVLAKFSCLWPFTLLSST